MKVKRIASFITVVAIAAVGITCVFAAACKKDEHEHSYESKVTKEATCTEEGERTYTCTDGDDEYTEVIVALGHNYETKTDAATCTEAGTTYEECSRCHDIQNTQTSGAALGHELTGKYDSTAGTWAYTCSRCSETIDIANDPVASLTLVADSGSAFVSANAWSANSTVEAVIDLTTVISISSTTDYKLTKDVVVEDGASIGVSSSLTLDLNGKSVTKAESATDGLGTIQVGSSSSQYGALTIKDSSTAGTGTVSGLYAVTVFGASSTSSNSTLTVQSGNITSVNGLAISTSYPSSNVAITISGGKISSANGTAVYLPGGSLTVSGGEISGDTGIEIRGGTLSVTGGTISTTATGTPTAPNTSSSGATTASGYAIAETNNSSYGSTVSVTISGGTINGTMYSTGTAGSYNISVTGGTFTVDPSDFVASGKTATQSGSSWTVA